MKIKTISFNIRYRDDENGHTIKERSVRLKSLLDRENADIIGLQECTPEWLTYLQRDYSDKYEISNVWRIGYESTPIMVKKDAFDILDKGCFWLSDTPEKPSNGWDTIGCNRICTWVKLKEKSTQKEFLFLNTHFGFGDDGQCKSVELINRFSNGFKGMPIVLTGDFNMEKSFPAYKLATSYFIDANESTKKDNSVTFHGYFLPENTPKLIDYIFIKSCLAKDYYILNDDFDGKYPSDHFGIKSTIVV